MDKPVKKLPPNLDPDNDFPSLVKCPDGDDSQKQLEKIFKFFEDVKDADKTKSENGGIAWRRMIPYIVKQIPIGAIDWSKIMEDEKDKKVKNTHIENELKLLYKWLMERPNIIKEIDTLLKTTKENATAEEWEARTKSFFDMIISSIEGNGGIFNCQEDNYLTLDKFLYNNKSLNTLNGKNIGYIRATKVKTYDNGIATPIQSALETMWNEGFVGEGVGSGLYNTAVTNSGNDKAKLGDGVTIYYDKSRWELVGANCSAGKQCDNEEYLYCDNKTDTEKIKGTQTDDASIVAKFQLILDPLKQLIVATTHLESGAIHKKGVKEEDKDTARGKSVDQLLTIINEMNAGKTIPVIFGMDANSSQNTSHTCVVDKLNGEGFSTNVEGHTPRVALTAGVPENASGLKLSSIKKRGKITRQPWKGEAIVAQIDALVSRNIVPDELAKLPQFTGDYSSADKATVAKENDTYIEKYGLPSDWFNYTLPGDDGWDNIENWKNWASDHLPLRATYKLGDLTFTLTTLNALSLALSFDGFLVGTKWKELQQSPALAPRSQTSETVKVETEGEETEAEAAQTDTTGQAQTPPEAQAQTVDTTTQAQTPAPEAQAQTDTTAQAPAPAPEGGSKTKKKRAKYTRKSKSKSKRRRTKSRR